MIFLNLNFIRTISEQRINFDNRYMLISYKFLQYRQRKKRQLKQLDQKLAVFNDKNVLVFKTIFFYFSDRLISLKTLQNNTVFNDENLLVFKTVYFLF